MNLDLMKQQLERHEGRRNKPYQCTSGKITIGVGRNLDDIGLTEGEIDVLLEHDIARCMSELDTKVPWWRNMSDARQRALLDMCFNLGISRLLLFKKAIAAMQVGDYNRAADEMLDSTWAKQVGRRAVNLSSMMRSGK
jgi:lysozyme